MLFMVQTLSSLPVFRLVSSFLFYIARDLSSTLSLPPPSLEASLLLPLRDVVLPSLLAPLILLDVALQAVLLTWALTFQALLYLVYFGLFVSCHLTGNMSRLEKPGSYRASNTFDSNTTPSNTFTSKASPTSNSPSNTSPSNKFSPTTTSSPSIKKVAKREGDESGYVTEEVEE